MNARAVQTTPRMTMTDEHVHRGRGRGPLGGGDRDVDQGAQRQRQGHDADRRHADQAAGQDRRPERVAHHDDAHLEQGRRVGGLEVRRRRSPATPTSPISRPDHGRPAEAVGPAADDGDDGPHERDAGHQQARQRAREVLLGGTEHDPRDGDLDQGEGHDPPPPRQHRAEVEAGERDRQQDRRADRRAHEDQRRPAGSPRPRCG